MIHYDVHENCPIFNTTPPISLSICISTNSPLPPLQKITNQLKENIIQGWLLLVIGSSLQVGFRFQHQFINLWLLFISLKPRYLLFRGFIATLVCAVVQKYHEMSFIYNYSHFWYSFCNQPVLFAKLENVSKPWNNSPTVHANERNQNKNKSKVTSYSNWPRVLLFDLAHKQCIGFIKEWLHCLRT